mmetsp:Transcript_70651/g.159812  ORF Transcript_70651/g.159812 Transcript_70651/m.159812 type:complete len:293 (-) Transcript_70651:510-1388(-)
MGPAPRQRARTHRRRLRPLPPRLLPLLLLRGAPRVDHVRFRGFVSGREGSEPLEGLSPHRRAHRGRLVVLDSGQRSVRRFAKPRPDRLGPRRPSLRADHGVEGGLARGVRRLGRVPAGPAPRARHRGARPAPRGGARPRSPGPVPHRAGRVAAPPEHAQVDGCELGGGARDAQARRQVESAHRHHALVRPRSARVPKAVLQPHPVASGGEFGLGSLARGLGLGSGVSCPAHPAGQGGKGRGPRDPEGPRGGHAGEPRDLESRVDQVLLALSRFEEHGHGQVQVHAVEVALVL